jgi:D-alanine-D-alanine ligase
MSSEEVVIDIAFPVFHGLSGEDGTFQGLCDLLSVPYIGCGLTTSALALDKVLAKDVLNSFGIPTKAYLYFSASEWSEHAQILSNAIEAEIELPVFVKPARVGSGLGVSKVSDTAELADAVAKALEFDSKILVEEAVSNPIDIMVSVTGNYFKPEQIQISKPQYRDPDTKLFKSVAISKPETEEIITLAKKTFIAFEGTGISQIDIIKNSRDNSLFVTEVDTIPHDLALPAWEASNISAEEVIRELVRLADENYEHLKNK